MNVLVFTVLVWSISFVAGFFGSLTGLGGGAVIVPALVLLFGVDIRYAIGASLVSIIATSSGAASAYVKEGFTNIRVGMLLEIATTFGALVGAGLATRVSTQAIAIVFGAFLIYSAVQSFLLIYAGTSTPLPPDSLATRLKLNGEYPAAGTSQQYNVQNVPAGFSMMFGAGALSGLLGVGSGPLKVIAMDRAMKLPFKVSTTTSNFMIGVTAAASAGVYLSRGYIQPVVTLPVMIGVLIGAFLGSKALIRAQVALLRKIFAGVIFLIAIEMIYNGLTGKL
jgi:uncharacterized membrane protein YfcA